MCACCGKYLAKTEELHLDSKKVDLHKACEKLLYVVENEKGRPMYSRTVTSLTGVDGSQKTFHLHKDGILREGSEEIFPKAYYQDTQSIQARGTYYSKLDPASTCPASSQFQLFG